MMAGLLDGLLLFLQWGSEFTIGKSYEAGRPVFEFRF